MNGVLEHIASAHAALPLARRALDLVGRIYPICRSISGDGVRATLEHIGHSLPLDASEVPTGTPVSDWEIPREWNIRDAYIADATGRRLVDFGAHALHVVGYSVPFTSTSTSSRICMGPLLAGVVDPSYQNGEGVYI